jgi:hypothetical protein
MPDDLGSVGIESISEPTGVDFAMTNQAEKLLEPFADKVRELSLELRRTIKHLLPQAGEKVQPGWRKISYRCEAGKQFCAIGPHMNYVNLYFYEGAELEDPDGLLEGGSREMRHVRLQSAADVESKALISLIKAAARHAGCSTD